MVASAGSSKGLKGQVTGLLGSGRTRKWLIRWDDGKEFPVSIRSIKKCEGPVDPISNISTTQLLWRSEITDPNLESSSDSSNSESSSSDEDTDLDTEVQNTRYWYYAFNSNFHLNFCHQ